MEDHDGDGSTRPVSLDSHPRSLIAVQVFHFMTIVPLGQIAEADFGQD